MVNTVFFPGIWFKIYFNFCAVCQKSNLACFDGYLLILWILINCMAVLVCIFKGIMEWVFSFIQLCNFILFCESLLLFFYFIFFAFFHILYLQCEDPRCHVWQHISCVIIPERPTEGVLPKVPTQFYCEICRINRADPYVSSLFLYGYFFPFLIVF